MPTDCQSHYPSVPDWFLAKRATFLCLPGQLCARELNISVSEGEQVSKRQREGDRERGREAGKERNTHTHTHSHTHILNAGSYNGGEGR